MPLACSSQLALKQLTNSPSKAKTTVPVWGYFLRALMASFLLIIFNGCRGGIRMLKAKHIVPGSHSSFIFNLLFIRAACDLVKTVLCWPPMAAAER